MSGGKTQRNIQKNKKPHETLKKQEAPRNTKKHKLTKKEKRYPLFSCDVPYKN
jgi:hypothetical protein